MNNLEEHLNTKSKEELIKILQRLIKDDKELALFIDDRTDNIPQLIKRLRYNDWSVRDFVKRARRIHKLILMEKNPLQNLLVLFYKTLKIIDTNDQSDALDNLAILIIKSIKKEMTTLPENQAEKVRKEIESKLEYQDFLLDWL